MTRAHEEVRDMLRLGFLLAVVGAVTGAIGDWPLGSPLYRSLELMVAGGLMMATGVVLILLKSGQNNSRADEGPGYIRP